MQTEEQVDNEIIEISQETDLEECDEDCEITDEDILDFEPIGQLTMFLAEDSTMPSTTTDPDHALTTDKD